MLVPMLFSSPFIVPLFLAQMSPHPRSLSRQLPVLLSFQDLLHFVLGPIASTLFSSHFSDCMGPVRGFSMVHQSGMFGHVCLSIGIVDIHVQGIQEKACVAGLASNTGSKPQYLIRPPN